MVSTDIDDLKKRVKFLEETNKKLKEFLLKQFMNGNLKSSTIHEAEQCLKDVFGNEKL